MKRKFYLILVLVLTSILLASPIAHAATVLKVGSNGAEVKQLQLDLQEIGYNAGPIDGIFGSKTKVAVTSFQTSYGLQADGVVGPLTRTALTKALERFRKTQGIISTAKSFIGVPYLWGGTTPAGFDCSGFTQYVFKGNGIELPRVSKDQFTVGTTVQFNSLQSGDLVFFSFLSSGQVSHVGIYLGNGQFISATSSKGVVISSFTSYWLNSYVGAKRVY
ncbi:MAG: NlpC/P60 family protein [Desulfitobacterium hafniense]|nr:NlpC/P60 family protein [Desulfitobacterium hafniense]